MNSLISPAKRQVLAGLVNARKTIKKKFKRAYTDRIKRERKLKETFKPITASIDTLSKSSKKKSEQDKKKNTKKKKNRTLSPSSSSSSDHGGNDVFETEQFRPKRQHATSTPKAMTRKRLSYSDGDSSRLGARQRTNQTTGYSDLFQSAIGSDSSGSTVVNSSSSGGKKKKTPTKASRAKKASISPSKFAFDMPTLTRSDIKNLQKLDTKDFEYTVHGDFDSPRNYDQKSLPDAAMVRVRKTDKATGFEEDLVVRFAQLPESAKRDWIRQRKNMYPQISQSRTKRNREVEARRRQTTTEDDFSDDTDDESRPSTSQQTGQGLKNSNKLVDFNFIPYNVKNRIIYEYFDDPNELCDRLQLLVSSRLAGNTNHMQEINSIIEELQELGCIA